MTQSEADRQKDLEERLAFETLLADLSSRFVNLPADQVDGVVEDSQRRICECLGLDLSTLWQRSMEDPHDFTLTHVFRPPTYVMGVNYAKLPAGCISPNVGGTTYYLCGNTWFQPLYGANGVYYHVVPTP